MDNQNVNEVMNLFKGDQFEILLIGVIIVLALVIVKPWVQVGAGERGVVQNLDAVQDVVLNEGLHFIAPVMQTVIKLPVNYRAATHMHLWKDI